MRSEVSQEDYLRLITSLYYVYSAMEEELDRHAEHPALAALYFPKQLARAAAALEDVQFFSGGAAPQAPSPNTVAYVARLRELSATDPALLIAHAYTRYLGDLSGGQMLSKRLQNACKLSGKDGVHFYDFPEIGNIVMFKNEYRELLDSAPVDDATAQRIVEEAVLAFKLNGGLFMDAAPWTAESGSAAGEEATESAAHAHAHMSGLASKQSNNWIAVAAVVAVAAVAVFAIVRASK